MYKNKKELIKEDLLLLKNIFDSVGIKFIIMGGIVLGYARYKDIMEWDTDIDICICSQLKDVLFDDLYKNLIDSGFKNINGFKTDFSYGYRKVEFNLWVLHKNGNYYEAFPKTTPKFKFVEKAIWYDLPQELDFIGNHFLFPNHIDDYLICQYGLDWKTNVVKNHEEYYIDKRGSRDVSLWPSGRATKEGDLWPKVLNINDTMV